MGLVIKDFEEARLGLLPLTFTRPAADLRIGITTIREKWQALLGATTSTDLTASYLQERYPAPDSGVHTFVAGNVVPTAELAEAVLQLLEGEGLRVGETPVAFYGDSEAFAAYDFACAKPYEGAAPVVLHRPYDIFRNNGRCIEADYAAACAAAPSQPLPEDCRLVGPATDDDGMPLLYIAPGATVACATFNTTHGPIYVGPDAEVMEGSNLRGPIALCCHATVNMGTKIYPGTTIGPWCKVGGELNNVIFIGYSNKAHDGFLGNAVIGEWCNLGADTVASNLKNDYSNVRVWNYATDTFERTDLQFCGLVMGDHSKAGINTMFNTATVVGVGCNIHGAGFPRTYIPSFSIGGAAGFTPLSVEKVCETAVRVMARRHKELSDAERRILHHLASTTTVE